VQPVVNRCKQHRAGPFLHAMIASLSANPGILPGLSTSRTHDLKEHRTARLTLGRSLSGLNSLVPMATTYSTVLWRKDPRVDLR